MIDIEECRKIVLDSVNGRFSLGKITATGWGYIVTWDDSVLGMGPALVDGETGYVFLTSSQLKNQDEKAEFGLTMMRMQGYSKKAKEEAWLGVVKQFNVVPFF